ncbi:MAG: hypothetical protein HKN20_09850, partial [Gemmatimonadetes bacterium]|nr:hypothetical protein [Gemmatimonadota bacterium]
MNRLRHTAWSAAAVFFVAAALAFPMKPAYGSTEIEPTEGIQSNPSTVFAFTGGTIVSEPG